MFDRIGQGIYWDRLLRIVDGCTPCSPGCRCWVAREAKVRTYGAKDLLRPDGMWNGQIRLRHDNLDLPLRTKKPQAWLILNDLFHENVPEKFIDDSFWRMANCKQHIFLVLTKRPSKMLQYTRSGWANISNAWIGVTVCNQQEADEKIPLLLQIPATVRFLSLEPLLGPIDLSRFIWNEKSYGEIDKQSSKSHKISIFKRAQVTSKHKRSISLCIVGGETGPGARPMHADWVRSVRDQCQEAGVMFFFKGWGQWALAENVRHLMPLKVKPYKTMKMLRLDGSEIKTKERFDPVLGDALLLRVGKKSAGRLLDGKAWNQIPETK